jgi:RHS repeat-associated protein
LILQAQTDADARILTPNLPVPQALAHGRRGFGTVHLTATTEDTTEVHTFETPLDLTFSYTPEQLTVLGIAEADLTIFWFDDRTQQWVPEPTTVDPATQTASTRVAHFSAYQLGDGSKPSDAFIPSLKDWQVGLYTGGVNYSYPFELPAGPAGVKPKLDLGYSSNGSDGAGGTRLKTQAGWVGKGWSLDPGSVAINDVGTGSESMYSMSVNGMSFSLVRTAARVANPNTGIPSDWEWRATDESFVRVYVEPNGVSYPANGGTPGRGLSWWGQWKPRYLWKLWTKDGTRYEFSDDLWRAYVSCPDSVSSLEAYRWMLSRIVDVHGNVINYTYTRNSIALGDQCAEYGHPQGTVDWEIYLNSVTWGGERNTGNNPLYRVNFTTQDRTINSLPIDTQVEGSTSQMGGVPAQPRNSRILRQLSVESRQGSAAPWQVVRQYRLDYADPTVSLTADSSLCTANCTANYLSRSYAPNAPDTSYRKVTLTGITRLGNDGTTALPSTTFTYGQRGTAFYPQGGWNRLTQVNNGQGGTLTFTYENVAQARGTTFLENLFLNYNRIVNKTANNGLGQAYTWSYTYQNPAFNTFGTLLDSNSTQTYPNSAILYINKYGDPLHDRTTWLTNRVRTEFRGHSYVKETDPNGTQTEHWFYQGDVGCYPSRTQNGTGLATNYTAGDELTYDTIYTNPCFVQMRDRELLKGKEYRTRTLRSVAAGSGVLNETNKTFAVDWRGNGGNGSPLDLAGLWRAFTYEQESATTVWEGGSLPLTTRKVSTYDLQYGNLTRSEEYDETNALYVVNETQYETLDTASTYIVDRKRSDVVRDAGNTLLALTTYFYDGNTTQFGLIDRGRLTLVRKYSTITPSYVYGTTTINSVDTSYLYDDYGNRTHETGYAGEGFRSGTATYSPPGNGSTPATRQTDYDPIFHAFSIKVTMPSATPGAVPLTEQAGYDYRMGTMTSVTGPNGTATTMTAEYDVFGRLVKIIKPGDTSAIPTVVAIYDDYALPFRYIVAQREVSGAGGNQPVSSFYDGLGRNVQTKTETVDGAQNSVTNTEYDGLNNVTRSYAARFVNETPSTTFWTYVAPPTGAYSTTTTYDAVSRPLSVTNPDGTRTTHTYGVVEDVRGRRTYHNVIDPNRHLTQSRTDSQGRLEQVIEFTGTCNNTATWPCTGAYTVPWAASALTRYTYSPLDGLTSVIDGQNNVTTLGYDSLNRKRTMSDPDMGAWQYTYTTDGSLLTQTDAKNQTITFGYDALSRMISKTLPSGQGTVTYRYDETTNGHTNGKGQRTSMVDPSGNHHWAYTARGEVAQEWEQIVGVSGIYTTTSTYRADGQVATLRYPTNELLTYSYSAARKQTAISSSLGDTYVVNTTYDAQGQLLTEQYGNNVTTTNTYYASNGRLYNTHLTGPQSQTLFRRYYTYDGIGNVRSTESPPEAEALRYFYDDQDRLTTACAVTNAASNTCLGGSTFNQSYTYDLIGNLTTKAGVSYTYPTNGVRPHAVATVGGQVYSYDANGNLQSGGGRTYTWNAENQPTQITRGTTTETYLYNGDNERVKKTSVTGGTTTTTAYIGGLLEYSGATVASNYDGNAVRTTTGAPTTVNRGVLTYLHGEQLGSISVTTRGYVEGANAAGTVKEQQRFDPWGAVRSGGITATEFNYTSQRKDAGTGLLFYKARYYDPGLGRFLSADSLVPGVHSLTVGMFDDETREAFPRHPKDAARNQGPSAPQELNRYSYVNNNPLTKNDPTGHCSSSSFWKTAVNMLKTGCMREAWTLISKGRTKGEKALGFLVGGLGFLGRSAAYASGGALLYAAGAWIGGRYVTNQTFGIVAGNGNAPVLKGAIADQVPSNLTQQLALSEAKSGVGNLIMRNLGDSPRLNAIYGAGEWVKYQHVHVAPDGTKTVLHWFRNLATGLDVEFKYK